MCLITIIAGAGISVIALMIVRKTLGWESFKENHEVGGFLFNALGLIYAVLIAFVVFASWQDYNDAKSVCEKEANTLYDLLLNSEGLPPETQPLIREKIKEYLQEVIEVEWPLLEKGEASPASKAILTDLWRVYMNLDSLKDDKQKIIFEESLGKLNDITDYRRLRIMSSSNHIPAIIWTVIVIGALTSVGFSLLFGTRSFAVQATMTSLFTITNAIIILMILSLDHPFTGDNKISTESYLYVLKYLQGYVPL
jgi:hypothetical protein